MIFWMKQKGASSRRVKVVYERNKKNEKVTVKYAQEADECEEDRGGDNHLAGSTEPNGGRELWSARKGKRKGRGEGGGIAWSYDFGFPHSKVSETFFEAVDVDEER